MDNGRNVPSRPHLNNNQTVLQSTLRVAQSGIEMIEFTIPLGIMELRCSCPIPDEGTSGSPVYVHMRPARPPRDAPRPPRDASSAAPVPPRRSNGGDHERDDDESWGNRGTYGT